jgi:hypothetical protein
MKLFNPGLIVAIVFCCNTAIANDSAGTTAAGGIVFQKTPTIVMQKEALVISPTQVLVQYQFKNIATQAITKTILFPLPPYKIKGGNAAWDREVEPGITLKDAPFLNFSVTVNGKSVSYNTIIRAVVNGQDITQKLQAAHLPLNPDQVAGIIPENVDPKQVKIWQQTAKKLHLFANGEPLWQKQIIFSFSQTFPSQQVVYITHRYKPAAGVFFGYRAKGEALTDQAYLSNDRQRAQNLFDFDMAHSVLAHSFMDWLRTRIHQSAVFSAQNCAEFQQGQMGCLYSYYYNVDYILVTAANWADTIRDFRLTIKYPKTGAVTFNDFYQGTPVKMLKVPGEITITMQHFLPRNNLKVLFALRNLVH